jgi:hypothetical protein
MAPCLICAHGHKAGFRAIASRSSGNQAMSRARRAREPIIGN